LISLKTDAISVLFSDDGILLLIISICKQLLVRSCIRWSLLSY